MITEENKFLGLEEIKNLLEKEYNACIEYLDRLAEE